MKQYKQATCKLRVNDHRQKDAPGVGTFEGTITWGEDLSQVESIIGVWYNAAKGVSAKDLYIDESATGDAFCLFIPSEIKPQFI